MPNAKSLRTLALGTRNAEAAERFYTQVLGGTVQNRIQHPGDGGIVDEVFIELGSFRVALASLQGQDRSPSGFPHYTVVLDYQTKEDLQRQLADCGVEPETIRNHHDGHGYSCYVRDPDGNRFELWVG
ncbi:MAG: VOC family protein [Chloroflexi bacterium]|nr:VOC family protein [Chloroflexota bacterium]